MAKRITEIGPRLRHRIDIEEAVETADSRSAQSEAWQTIRDSNEPDLIPAEILELSGRELVAANAIVSGASSRITIRYRVSPVNPVTMRVVHGSTVYDILAAIPDDTLRKWVTLYCQRGLKSAG